ncbi:unnamed protein product [Rhizoctonia solani]|uniref:Uncharacterized protein n=1 Tax=Rhizoctonia solani TaxID=456999 RepID=A0A8H3B1S3_9AGAM|nr:unnamed protein product [Rhizoctonia solani]
MPDGNQSPTRLGATPPLEDKKTWIEKSSELLFHLFNLQLLSLAQISEYVSRVIKRPGALINTHLGNMMAGVRLLVGLFPGCSHGPWEKEVNSLRKWIDQHSSLDGNQANATIDCAIQEKEPRSGTVDTDNPRSHSVLCSSNKSNNPSPKSFNAPIVSSKTAHSSQRYNLKEEMDGTPGNNIGRPPRTPDTLRAESPVDTSSVDFSIFPPESTQWHTARGSSIKEEGRKASQAAEAKAIKKAKHQTKEDSAARDQEKAGRNAKEKRWFKEEAKRKEEIRAKLEAERKVNEQTARKAREEAEHRAKVDKMREEMEKLARREAEIKARRAREQEAQEEEVRKEMERKAKEDKTRVDKMREEMERMVQKEAELKAKRAAEHRARVEKMREDMEKMVQREAELRAKRERERKEKVRKAWEEAEEEKERRQAELEAQKMTELQAKEEAKRKALEPVPTHDPAPPRGPPQWELDGYYDLLHRGFIPYMYAGGLPEP